MNAPKSPEVRYALLQESLAIPCTEGLRRAFESVRKLTAADAPTMARDAYGILVKDLDAQEASTLKEALAREGILTEPVPHRLLPQLPATKFVRQFSFGEDCLLIRDPLGRPVPLEYRHLSVMAAGEVELRRLDRRGRGTTRSGLRGRSAGWLDREELTPQPELRTREVRVHRHLIELIVGRNAARFTLEADADTHLLFTSLGDRRTADLMQNLSLLVRELSRSAPRMLLNRGAYALRGDPPRNVAYPSKNAFYEELTWILWQAIRQNYGEASS